MEIAYWLQDVLQHVRVSRQRKNLRQPNRGFDYSQDRAEMRRVVDGLHPRRMRLRVTEITQATATAKTFRCLPAAGPLPPFRAGQYINVFATVGGVSTSRPYSIASAPGAEYLELTVRDKQGGFVAPFLLTQVKVGDELETTGPAGSFYHEPLIDGGDLVLLAGGSGITPFMSIIRDITGRDLPIDVHLLYGSRLQDDVIYGDELIRLAGSHPRFRCTVVISEPPEGVQNARFATGLLDASLIRQQVGDVTGKTFYVCGPGVMYDFCLCALDELGVPRHRVRREVYGPPADVTQEPGWPDGLAAGTAFRVEVEGGEAISATAGEPLMNTLERHAIVLPAVCRSGACSACRTRLVSGQVFMPAHTALREADRWGGYIHPCVSYPISDLKISLP